MFEGIIDYKMTVRPNLHWDWLNKRFKGIEFTHKYYYSKGRYKIVINNPERITQIFDGCSMVYTFDSEMNLIESQDATIADKSILSHEVTEEIRAIVLGYNCKALKITTGKGGEEYYYYHSILNVDPDQCQNHKLTNWDFITTKTGSLPLKHIVKTRYKIIELIATNIQYQSLEDDLFSITCY